MYFRGGETHYSEFHTRTKLLIEYFAKKKNMLVQKPKFTSEKKLKNILKNLRAGDQSKKELLQLVAVYVVNKTQQTVVFLLAALKSKPNNIVCRFLCHYLVYLMNSCSITIYYDACKTKTWIFLASGGAFGLSLPWLSFAGTFILHVPLTLVLGRSIYHQVAEYLEYIAILKRAKELGILRQVLQDLIEPTPQISLPLPNVDEARTKLLKMNMNVLNRLLSEGAEKQKLLPLIKVINSISEQTSISRLEAIKQVAELAVGEPLFDIPGISTLDVLNNNPIMGKPKNLGIRIQN